MPPFMRFPYLSPDTGTPGGGGGGNEPTEIEVDLADGVKVKLPREQAQKVIASRDERKASDRQLREELGRHKATAAERETAARKAEEDKQAIELAKKGEMDGLRELLTKQHTEKITGLANRYRDTHLESAVSQCKELLRMPDDGAQRALVRDIVRQLSHSCRFNLDADTLEVVGQDGRPALGSDGKPLPVDAAISQFLAERPYFRQPSPSRGSGATGGGTPTPLPKSMTSAEYDAAIADPIRSQAVAKAVATGAVTVTG